MDPGGVLRRVEVFWALFFLVGGLAGSTAQGQQPVGSSAILIDVQLPIASNSPAAQHPPQPKNSTDGKAADDGKGSAIDSPKPKIEPRDSALQQTKRILWIIPNYRSVSADTQLPPQSVKEKFWLATQDTFDYSNFIFTGILAGISMGNKSEPSFGQGAAGYGRYYWHTFADGGIENYMVEAIVPTLTKEDPRYYTLGKGGFFKRTGYSFSRLLITRTDSGRGTLNLSEVVGAGAAAGIGNAYYPSTSNLWVKTYQRWGTQLALDALGNVAKEFWPDINHTIFHNKY